MKENNSPGMASAVCSGPRSVSSSELASSRKPRMLIKTVLSSPYQKSMSSTPTFSPMFRTPKGATLSKQQLTPQSQIKNPFEIALLNHLQQSMVSPDLMTKVSTPDSEEKKFEWTIDEIAVLRPANLDHMPLQNANEVSPGMEENAQKDIENYFSTHLVVPSPWSDANDCIICSGKLSCKCNYLLMTKKAEAETSQQKLEMVSNVSNSNTQEVACQTTLTLPVDFNLQNILGEFMSCQSQEEPSLELLSTSSLRRKLFFQGDESLDNGLAETEPCEVQTDISTYEPLTPGWDDNPLTPSTLFSSSPLRPSRQRTTIRSRFSHNRAYCLTSPEISPISYHQLQDQKGFSSFDQCMDTSACQKLNSSPPVSPVSSLVAEKENMPLDCRAQKCSRVIFSPGPKLMMANLSPVHSMLISRENFDSLGEKDVSNSSFTWSVGNNEAVKEFTPEKKSRGSSKALMGAKPSSVKSDESAYSATCQPNSELTCKNYSFEYPECLYKESVLNINTTSQDMYHQTSSLQSVNQDTGYQTTSLQLTNQENGYNQHILFPVKLNANLVASSIELEKNPQNFHLSPKKATKIFDVSKRTSLLDSGLSQDDVIERAKQILALTDSTNMSQDQAFQWHPIGSSTPQKEIEHQKQVQHASEKAAEIIKKASEDLSRVCQGKVLVGGTT